MKYSSHLVLLVASALSLAMVQAPAAAGTQGAKGECKADIEQFCKDVQPGEGRIHRCLKQNQDRLSATCQAKIEKAKERRLACKSDKDKFCKDVQPGQGRIRACMREHEAELSSQCKAFL